MSDLRQALAEINAIRTQVARDTQFRGYGPASIACSGLLALLVAALQARYAKSNSDFTQFLSVWVATAAVAVILTAAETISKARKAHSVLADKMIYAAVEQFLPAIVVAILLTAVVLRVAPASAWMLPGLWELLFSLGVFASCRFLPRQTIAVGIWYLSCGLACLVLQSGSKMLSPWSVGMPFGVGQLLVAGVLQFYAEGSGEGT